MTPPSEPTKEHLRLIGPDDEQATIPFDVFLDPDEYEERAAGAVTLLLAMDEPWTPDNHRPHVRDAFGDTVEEMAGFERFVEAEVVRR